MTSSIKNFFLSPKYSSMLLVLSAFVATGISQNKVYLFHLVIVLLVYSILANLKDFLKVSPTILRDRYTWLPLLYAAIPLIYLIPSDFEYETFRRFIVNSFGVIVFFAFYILSVQSQQTKTLFLKAISWMILFQICVGIVEVLTSLRWSYIFYPPQLHHTIFNEDGSLFHSLDKLARPITFYYNPNNTSLVNLLVSPFLFILVPRKFFFIIFSCMLFLIFYGNSRGIMLVFLSFVTLWASYVLFKGKKNKRFFINFLIVIGLVGFIFAFKNNYQWERFWNATDIVTKSIEAINNIENSGNVLTVQDESISIRSFLSYKSFEIFRSSPVFGISPGGLTKYEYDFDGMKLTLGSIHNYWLEILTEYGILFFLLYIYWYLVLIYKLYKTSKIRNTKLCIACMVSLILFAPGVIVMSSAIYFLPKWVLYGFAYFLIRNEDELSF